MDEDVFLAILSMDGGEVRDAVPLRFSLNLRGQLDPG
jgi:hypothetical protein